MPATTTHHDLIPFDYQGTQVRTLEQDGHALFCGKDVATALGYKDPTNALKQHCRGVVFHHPISDRLGRTQDARFISEGDVYRLITHSKLPTAERFERWVFDEVLPSIRQHGAYATPSALEAMLSDPDTMIRVLTALKEEQAVRAAAEAACTELTAQAQRDAPKVLFADAVSTSTSTILVGDLAKILRGNGVQIGATRLFGVLRRRGYLINRRGTDWNMPTQRSMDLGLFKVKETAITHSDGHVTVSRTPKVTGKGQAYFITRILDGRIPLDDRPEKSEEPAA